MRKKATEKELEYWRKVARDSEELDKETTRGSGERRAALLAWVNRLRAKDGAPPLRDEEDPPELEFYRIARARGLIRRPDQLGR